MGFSHLIVLFVVLSAAQQPAPPPGLPQAMARLQAQDPAGALAIAEQVVAREPSNARAWRVLGIAAKGTKDLDRALAAFQKSVEIEPANPAGFYNTGCIYALKSDRDSAFESLGKAKATRKIDMTQIQTDPDLASLRDDPRFTALLPTAADFAAPFVEDVKILREWDGEAVNDQFGWIARPIGDVDRDGITDIVTSAPGTAGPGTQGPGTQGPGTQGPGTQGPGTQGPGTAAGHIYVYSTKTGKLLWKADGTGNDQLGTGVEGAGDTNKDGIPDVIASAPGSGHAYVYSGRDGHVLFTMTAEKTSDNFGAHASGAGDVNGDGHDDVIVGAPLNGANGAGAGRAYVYSGKDGKLLLTLTGEHAGDGFGAAVAGGKRGRRVFLIVGAPSAGASHHGRSYVYTSLTQTPAFVIDSDETGAALGAMFLSVLGDTDGDKIPDIYASDFSNSAKGPSTGRVYVHSGKDGHRLLTLTGEGAGEGFGIGPANAGDVNHDGHEDLIVGAWQYGGAAASGGRAYLYSGKDGTLLKTYTGKIPGETFGFDAVGIGDIDGDGTIDLLITSAWSGIKGFHSGRMFVISSGVR
jgi:Tetratricopeptide repeat/FG-GAP-like repeat/FG-GAP repeat